MSMKKKLLIGMIVAEVAIIAVFITFLFYMNSDTVKVNRQLELAQRYLLEEDYEQAIATFEAVIEIDPKNAEAYLGLAQAYAETDDLEQAVKILERGSKRTDSEEIQNLLDEHTKELAKMENDKTQQPDAAREDEATSESATDEAFSDVIEDEVLFEKYVSETLIPTYGIFRKSQSGTMHSMEDAWLDPDGMMDVTLMDFDLDGKVEMLVCNTTQIQNPYSYATQYQINLDMYEIVNGQVVLASSAPFVAYHDKTDAWTTLTKEEHGELHYNVSAVNVDGLCYIVCESCCSYYAFADGHSEDYWAMTYTNGELQYAFSFTKTRGGSSDFEYTGYEFTNGKLTGSQVYYSEWYEDDDEIPLYEDYELAITSFFKAHGIAINYDYINRQTILIPGQNDITRIFEFVNQVTSSDYSPDYSSSTHTFEASLVSYGISLEALQ